MIDIHNHILWGIDDGAQDEKMTLEMMRVAESEGIDTIVATPHFIHGQNMYTKDQMLKRLEEVQALANQHQIQIKFLPGNEVFIDYSLKELWMEKAFCTLADSRYVLIEFPMSGIPEYTSHILYELRLKGLIPIIAHPERYGRVQRDPNYLYIMLERGCVAQMNTGSITGMFGETVAKTARILLEHHMIHFIGTDAHTDHVRSPRVKEAYKQVVEWVGEDAAQQIFEENPKLIIEDKPVIYSHAKEYKHSHKKKQSFFNLKKLFGVS